MTEQTLAQQGYRYISRRHKIAARVDRPDWKENMAERHCPWDPQGEGMRWVAGLGGDAADYYRRVFSNDRITTRTLHKSIANSSGDRTGYVEVQR